MISGMDRFTPAEILGPLNEVEKVNAPEFLFVAGDIRLARGGRKVSVVGSRKASEAGLSRARFLVRSLVESGCVVVSGLAEGVDTVVHETALAQAGKTMAVIGTPLDECHPPANRLLQDRLAKEHLVVSQFPPGTPIQRKNFPMRNRTMALMSEATIIIEAGERSGTLHQGWEALRLGRLLFLMESVVKHPDLRWPAEMIRYGAQVLSRDNLDLVLENIPERTYGERIAL